MAEGRDPDKNTEFASAEELEEIGPDEQEGNESEELSARSSGLQTEVGGLRAVEMFYRGIREIETGSLTFLQSKTRLNTPGLGTLMPENYRDVAELTDQGLSIFDLEFRQMREALKKFLDRDFFFRWLSVYMPPSYLLERSCEAKIVSIIDEEEIDSAKICFEQIGRASCKERA